MVNNNPIEQWSREQCEEYLKHYPKSFNSEAVRKRYQAFSKEIESERKAELNQERERERVEAKRIEEEQKRKIEKERSRREISRSIDEGWVVFKKILKYGGLVLCFGLAVFIVVTAINTEYKITFSGVLPLAYAIWRLLEWDVER
jgi:hypothetical protein